VFVSVCNVLGSQAADYGVCMNTSTGNKLQQRHHIPAVTGADCPDSVQCDSALISSICGWHGSSKVMKREPLLETTLGRHYSSVRHCKHRDFRRTACTVAMKMYPRMDPMRKPTATKTAIFLGPTRFRV